MPLPPEDCYPRDPSPHPSTPATAAAAAATSGGGTSSRPPESPPPPGAALTQPGWVAAALGGAGLVPPGLSEAQSDNELLARGGRWDADAVLVERPSDVTCTANMIEHYAPGPQRGGGGEREGGATVGGRHRGGGFPGGAVDGQEAQWYDGVRIVDDHVEEAARARTAAKAGGGAWGAWGDDDDYNANTAAAAAAAARREVLPPAGLVVVVHAPAIVWRLSNLPPPREGAAACGDGGEGDDDDGDDGDGEPTEGVEVRLEELTAHYVSFELGHHNASRWSASVRNFEAVDLSGPAGSAAAHASAAAAAAAPRVLASYRPPGAPPRETGVCMLHVDLVRAPLSLSPSSPPA